MQSRKRKYEGTDVGDESKRQKNDKSNEVSLALTVIQKLEKVLLDIENRRKEVSPLQLSAVSPTSTADDKSMYLVINPKALKSKFLILSNKEDVRTYTGGIGTRVFTGDFAKLQEKLLAFQDGSPSCGSPGLKKEEAGNSPILNSPISNSPTPFSMVYTDGACHDNGRKNAQAAFGVYYGKKDPRNFSGRVPGKQTNQRAELSAVMHAMKIHLKSDNPKMPLLILSDSQYTVMCMTAWKQNWILNGFRNAKGNEVENRDLIQEMIALGDKLGGARQRTLEDLNSNLAVGPGVTFVHIRGHCNIFGNEMADQLAEKGICRN